MSNDSLIQSIKSAIADGKHEEARILLRVALKEPTAEIYYLASQVALNEQQRQSFIKKAKEINSSYSPEFNIPTPKETRNKSSQGISRTERNHFIALKFIIGIILVLMPIIVFWVSNANQSNLENPLLENEVQPPHSLINPPDSSTETPIPEPVVDSVTLTPENPQNFSDNSSQNTTITCPNALQTRLKIGIFIQVTTSGKVPYLGIRPEPTLETNKMFELLSGEQMKVLDGPRCANDSYFWYVDTPKGKGWVREGNQEFYFVDPLP